MSAEQKQDADSLGDVFSPLPFFVTGVLIAIFRLSIGVCLLLITKKLNCQRRLSPLTTENTHIIGGALTSRNSPPSQNPMKLNINGAMTLSFVQPARKSGNPCQWYSPQLNKSFSSNVLLVCV
jgi:hypothetical protein